MNTTDSHEKKAVTMAMINFSAVAANIYTAYLWPSSDGPRYIKGLGSSAGFCAVCILTALGTWFALRRENAKRLREDDSGEVRLYAL